MSGTSAIDRLELSERWPLVRLEDLAELVERHGITNKLATSALYLTLLSGRESNLHAAARNEYARHLADYANRLRAVLTMIPIPVQLCPAYDEFERYTFLLMDKVDALAVQYQETSWRTKRPHNLRRISWDLVEWWKIGTGQDATAWRPNSQVASAASGSDFYAFLADLACLLGEAPPAKAAVETWLKAYRDCPNHDYLGVDPGLE